ncbi:hypothetical protein [Serinicoccus sp. CUA-874]|uniref:hypothetical protein n=1 Tax=Serinicoccus sp. CUA-874 TaxID=1517939 RepID=UPI001179B6A7|nr:hypothetical protein [Serinicoccus sp. CUA-874]
MADFAENAAKILTHETDGLAQVAAREARALGHVDVARLRAEAIVAVNRGGSRGVHGFIAEFAETGITNAERAIDGTRVLTTVWANNGPADLHVGKSSVQMKFYADLGNEIRTSAGYHGMKMMFPKDHVEVFDRIMRGETHIEVGGTPLKMSQVRAIRELIENESAQRGGPYTEWMRASKLDYADVQVGTFRDTLDSRAQSLQDRASEQRRQVRDDANAKRAHAAQQAQASWAEAGQVAATGAAVHGGLAFVMFAYQRHKDGVKLWEFGREDWKAAGVETAKGSAKGGVTGLSIYGLTNVCGMSAPAAAAVASGAIGLAAATLNLRAGKVDDDEFADLALFNALDATGAAVGAALGQMVIPIPILGAVVGSIAANVILSQGKGSLNRAEAATIEAREAEIAKYISGLDGELQAEYLRITAQHDYYRALRERAFDLTANVELRMLASIDLARAVGVPEAKIIHDIEEADAFFLGRVETRR